MNIINTLKQKVQFLFDTKFLIVPAENDTRNKPLKLDFKILALVLTVYSLLVITLTFFVITLTPIKDTFSPDKFLTTQDERSIKEIKEKIINLTIELNKLKITNERLNRAIDSDSIQAPVKENKVKAGGSLLFAVKELFTKIFGFNQEKYLFTKPVDGFISRGFDPAHGHLGVDYALQNNTPIYAASGGFIVFADYTAKDGYSIIIDHGEFLTIYKHCSSLLKKERETVQQGELIALSGNSGYTSGGPHLHFELWKGNFPLDPTKYLSNK